MSAPGPSPYSAYAAPRVAEQSQPSNDHSVQAWLLAGTLGIVGGYILTASLPQFATAIALNMGPAMQSPFFVAQAILGFACVTIALLNAPGRKPLRFIGLGLVVVIALIAFFVLVLRLQPGGGAVLPGPAGHLLTGIEGWLILSGAAAWLLASGARPLAWITLIGALLVSPLRLLLAMQGVEAMLSGLILQIFMLVVAVAVLIVSKPRKLHPARAVPPSSSNPLANSV